MDIPLYATLCGEVKVRTLDRLFASFGVKHAYALGFLDNLVKEKEDYIRFFERGVEESISIFEKQLDKTMNESEYQVLITPLIMDFDCVPLVETNVNGISGVEAQLKHLLDSIASSPINNDKLKVCPFIGFDLRKLEIEGEFSKFKNIWKEYAQPISGDGDISKLKSGNVIGIKLYPPIGFNPYPEEESKKKKYINFYNWCLKENIPLTVHCQEGSYNAGNTQREVNRNAHPINWKRLFDENPSLRNLRVNFAHFGGEKGLEDMFDPWRLRAKGIDKKSWTYYLVKLLQKYPNTYADISAYDFADGGASKNFAELIDYSWAGKFGAANYKLTDKLLWGSDVPMVISSSSYKGENGKGSYSSLFNKFLNTVYMSSKLNSTEKQRIIEQMTVANPKHFLKIKV